MLVTINISTKVSIKFKVKISVDNQKCMI